MRKSVGELSPFESVNDLPATAGAVGGIADEAAADFRILWRRGRGIVVVGFLFNAII